MSGLSMTELYSGVSSEIIAGQVYAGNVVFDLRLETRASNEEARFVVNDEYCGRLFENCEEIYG